MAKLSITHPTSSDKAKDMITAAKSATHAPYEKAKDVAQSAYATAMDAAQNTYGNVQDTLHTGMGKASATVVAGLGLAEELLKRRQKQSRKISKMAQKRLSNFQEAIRDNINTGLSKASDVWANSTEAAQANLKKRTKKAQKNLGRAQKHVTATLEKTGERVNKRARQMNKDLHRATQHARDMKNAARAQYTRQVAKTLFRAGIIIGIVLALLFTPIAGPEVRSRIAARWEQYRGYLGL